MFKEGDLVIVQPRRLFASQEIMRHSGKVGQIVWASEIMTDYHKVRYEWFFNVKLRDGTLLRDLPPDDLKAADAITALGGAAGDEDE